ncbi:MAG: hypothetical protein AAFX06_04125 [Planctomycetota bacterium]
MVETPQEKSTSVPSPNQWSGLRENILSSEQTLPPESVFGDSFRRGGVYRWGIPSAFGACDEDPVCWQLTRLAVGQKVPKKQFRGGWEAARLEFQDRLSGSVGVIGDAWEALVWSAAMPGLMKELGEGGWWDLLGALQDYRDRVIRSRTNPTVTLLGAAELGSTLAWRLSALPSCRRLMTSSLELLDEWLGESEETLSQSLSEPKQTRLVLASLLRCRFILKALSDHGGLGTSRKWNASDDDTLVELATWVTAMTRRDGACVFDPIGLEAREDAGINGLLMRAGELDPESLGPAIESATGAVQTSGRLAWQVSLPEAMLHDEEACFACLLPEWDVRRGRIFVSYAQRDAQIELMAGKTVVLSGAMETTVVADGKALKPRGDWVATCEYTDDDVHYLELEQPWSGGYVVQRQLMLIREDRCCLIADGVLRGSQNRDSAKPFRSESETIEYRLSIPLASTIQCQRETETAELFLVDDKSQTMVLPLTASEWRSGSTQTVLENTPDGQLSLVARGRGQLYAPLWLDFTRARFRKKRTWRQLTVAEQLEIVTPNTATAFRVQVGKEQWILYRSMSDPVPRTFFGKHMIADFFAARFDAGSESFEDLITVDDELAEDE